METIRTALNKFMYHSDSSDITALLDEYGDDIFDKKYYIALEAAPTPIKVGVLLTDWIRCWIEIHTRCPDKYSEYSLLEAIEMCNREPRVFIYIYSQLEDVNKKYLDSY